MPTAYKGLMIPLSSDLADGPRAFQDYTDSLAASDVIKSILPAGAVISTVAATAPTGWLLLDGTLVVGAQTAWPNLWAVVPAAWRVGADLQLPDARGRLMVGVDPADTSMDAIGEKGGSKIITVGNLPSHSHGGTTSTGGAHVHSGVMTFTGTGGNLNLTPGYNLGSTASAGDHNHTIPAEGGGQPFMPPFIAFNWIIKAA